jgi:hypothetical protein
MYSWATSPAFFQLLGSSSRILDVSVLTRRLGSARAQLASNHPILLLSKESFIKAECFTMHRSLELATYPRLLSPNILSACAPTRALHSLSARLLKTTHRPLVIDHEHAHIVMIVILAAPVCGHTDACPAIVPAMVHTRLCLSYALELKYSRACHIRAACLNWP